MSLLPPQPRILISQPAGTNNLAEEILHGLLMVGMLAASIFVKNPQSQQKAATIVNILQTTVVPLMDQLVTQTPNASQSNT